MSILNYLEKYYISNYSSISDPSLNRPNVMLKFGSDMHGQHAQININVTESQTLQNSSFSNFYVSQYCCTAARLGYSQKYN